MRGKKKALGERAGKWMERIDDFIFYRIYLKTPILWVRNGLEYRLWPSSVLTYWHRYHQNSWAVFRDVIVPTIVSVITSVLITLWVTNR